MSSFDGLDRYSTIVADPPWHYAKVNPDKDREGYKGGGLPYSTMTVEQVAALPIGSIAEPDCRVWLWITNKYLRHGWDILKRGGPSRRGGCSCGTKKPRATTPVTTEFLMTGSMGRATPALPWLNSTWFDWPRNGLAHSQKPPAALDLIESVSPGPYVELFARAPRLGWDSWGRAMSQTEGHAQEA